jgi:uncharacterized protein (DUF1330 family)
MSAYIVFLGKQMHDESKLEEYKRLVRPTLAKFGAVVRVLRGEFEVLEGDPIISAAMIEFPTMEQARAWYRSPEYQEALKHRLAASSTQAVLCESLR